jgi:type VI secretion system protein ImpM
LTPAAPGFFGKLPSTGDFVARGLPEGFRRRWDRWVSLHLAPRQQAGCLWPAGGLRFRLTSGGRVAAGVVLPSEDAAGRRFPLSLVVIAEALPLPVALDPWCDAVAATGTAALEGRDSADQLWQRLAEIAPPDGDDKFASLLLWTEGVAPIPAEPDAPDTALDALLRPSVSSG